MEEKEILQAMKEMIAPLASDIKEMKTDIGILKTDVSILKTEMSDVKERLGNVEREVVATNLRIENDVIPGIQAIREGQKGFDEKVNVLATRTNDIEEDVILLKLNVFQSTKIKN